MPVTIKLTDPEAAGGLRGIEAPGPRVWLGGLWFSVASILAPVPLAPELDAAALVGWPVAQRLLAFDGSPTTVYTRSAEQSVEQVRQVLAATVNPQAPSEVKVSRPSDALAAARAAASALSGLLLGLGAVALIGAAVTAGYAGYRSWTPVVPGWAPAGGVLATMLVGMVAGLYPAAWAARLPPSQALSH